MLGQMLTPAYRAAAAMQLAVLVPWPALMCVVAWRGPARRRRSEAAFKAHCLAALIGGILTSGLLMLLMVALLHHTNANLGMCHSRPAAQVTCSTRGVRPQVSGPVACIWGVART